MPDTVISERMAVSVFSRAIMTGRAAELLEHLFDGGGVMIDPDSQDGLILIPALDIQRLAKGDFDA